ncbi:hypothetical protein MNBD_GAMMA22-1075 [hydrothermal vent metagenome]|uniref:Uncharacterized protein n=1 Tax=hydrothermal vent metagenome TaxID=652676 RepID=A0A3B1A7D9_9ZZZZ
MKANDFWSATTSVLLSDKMQSTIGGPEPIIDALIVKLEKAGIDVKNKHYILDNYSTENDYNTLNAARFTDDPGSFLNSMSLHTAKLHTQDTTQHFSNYMISLDIGADAGVVKHIENFLQKNGIHFNKQDALIEDNHIDFSYELTHIPELNLKFN